MSDSDESDTSSNVFTFPNMTTVSAKGPNTNVTTLNFPNQLTSSMFMPRNFAHDQKSMYYRRETSPMSTRSAYDIRSRNRQKYFRRMSRMSSQRSVFNGRSGSSMSVRSIDSSASVSVVDIAFALKNTYYNEKEIRVIKDAYHALMKQRVKRRNEKRRDMRHFMEGYDSGEQGSDSSISSDDCRSVKTYKENMSSAGSARIDLTDFRKSVKNNNVLRDWPDNFRHNTIKNNFSNDSRMNNTQKDRFQNGFLLPSQRFNRSVASLSIPEISENVQNTVMNNVRNPCSQKNACGSGDEIFSEKMVKERCVSNIEIQRKRGFHCTDEESHPGKKKYKVSSPIKNPESKNRAPSRVLSSTKTIEPAVNNIETTNTFEFVKPSLPVRKSKPKVQEQLISKSSQPLTDFLEPICSKIQTNSQSNKPFDFKAQSSGNSANVSEHDQSETTQPSDVSMRPSFIKRKLFTQKLDVAEKANLSTDGTNSPQNVYLQKEKNKARKLVTNQSCLNREVQDENNLLDLIHKIVPPDQMNISNQTTVNQNKTDLNSKNKQCNKDKWDVSSVISKCNEDDVSDTYTDEEIFEGDSTKQATKQNRDIDVKANSETNIFIQINQDCKVVVEKLQEKNNKQKLATKNLNSTNSNVNSTNVKGSVKSFWDTDSESEVEWSQRHVIDKIKKANALLEARKDVKSISSSANNICNVSKYSQPTPDVPKLMNNVSMNNTVMNNTLNSNRKFDPSNLSIRSHRTPKKKKCFNETCATVVKTNLGNQSSIIKEKKIHNTTEHNMKFVETNLKPSAQNKENPNSVKTSSHCTKSVKGKTSKLDKQDSVKKDSQKLKSSKPEQKASKLKPQNSSSGKKHQIKKQLENEQDKTISKSKIRQDDQKNKKNTLNKSPKNKHKSKVDRESNTRFQSAQNNSILKPSTTIQKKNVDLLQAKNSGRPLRSCRTPSQSRSIEFSRSSQLNDTSDSTRNLRSRVIDLSLSFENISNKIKPRNKTKKNEIITKIQTRNSDVSFSLGAEKRTLASKK